MLEDKVKNLLLKLAAVNAIVLECESNQAMIVNYSMKEGLNSQTQVVQREIKVCEPVGLPDDLGESFR